MANFFANLGAAAADTLPGITARRRARSAARRKQEDARRKQEDAQNAAHISRFERNTNAEFARQASDLFLANDEEGLLRLTQEYSDPDFGASPEVITRFKMGLPKLIQEMRTNAKNTTSTPLLGKDFERAEPELSELGMAETEQRFDSLANVPEQRNLKNVLTLNEMGRREDRQRVIDAAKRKEDKEKADLIAAQNRAGTGPGGGASMGDLTKEFFDIYNRVGSEISPAAGVSLMARVAKMKGVTVEPEEAGEWLEEFAHKKWAFLANAKEEQSKVLSGTETVQILGERVLDKMQDPRTRAILNEHFNRLKGIRTEMEMWITGSPPTDVPPEVLEFRQALGFASDKFARVRSGAALTPYEQRFYRSIIGSQFTTPEAIYVQVMGLIDQLNDERMQVYETLSRPVYGPVMPEEIKRELPMFRSKYVRVAPNGTVGRWNPFTQEWETN